MKTFEGEKGSIVLPTFSLIIPTYNEEQQIDATLQYVLEYLNKQPFSFEIVVVDDGSKDNTVQQVQKWVEQYPEQVKVVPLPKNHGKGYAVREAILHHTSGSIRCFYDADASTPIEEIDKLIQELNQGYDIAIASRALPESIIEIPQPLYRQMMGKIYNLILRIFRLTHFHDTQCGCKCFNEKAVNIVFPKQTLSRFSFDAEILYIAERHNLKIKEVPTRWRNRKESRVHPIKDSFKMFCDLFKIRWNAFTGKYN